VKINFLIVLLEKNGIKMFLPFFPFFSTDLSEYDIEDFHIVLFSNFNFRENRCFETHTLLKKNEMLPGFYVFIRRG